MIKYQLKNTDTMNFNCLSNFNFVFRPRMQNSLNNSVMAGAGEVDLDAAARMLDRHMSYDSMFPSLTDKIQVSSKGKSCLFLL